MKKKYIFLLMLVEIAFTGFSQIPTNGLVAWYPFYGNANDASGNGNNGTVNGAILTPDRFGNANCAYYFDGVNDYIVNNSLNFSSFGSTTINVWFKFSTLYGYVLMANSDNSSFEIFYSNGIVFRNWDRQCCTVFDLVYNQINLNTWYFLTWTSDYANNSKLYINGTLVASTTTIPEVPSSGTFHVGKHALFAPPSGYFNGVSDDIRIYNRVLSQSEITALFHEQPGYISPYPNNLSSVPEPNCLTLTSPNTSGWQWSTGETTKSISVCKYGNYSCNTDTIGVFITKFNDSTYTPNGQVYSVARKGDTVYMGGQFDYLARVTGKGAMFQLPRDANVTGMPRVNGSIDFVVPDGSGGWYLAGDFTKIGIDSVKYLAHINSARKLDTTFDPRPNGKIKSICLHGNRIYVGGNFTKMGDVTRGYLLQLDRVTGMATSWDPQVNGPVNSVVAYGDKIYVGGTFTSLGSAARNYLGSIDTSYAFATIWNPGPNQKITKLVQDGIKLYVLGDFTTISALPRTRLASYTVVTGIIDTWSPNPNNTVYDLVVSGSNVYVGGRFNSVGGGTRNFLAALNNTNGNVTTWTPVVNDTVLALSILNNVMYCGGRFTSVNTSGTAVDRLKVCSFDLATNQVTSWAPQVIGTTGQNAKVNTIAASGGNVFIGGDFFGINCIARNYLAAINAVNGIPTAFYPVPNGKVRSIYLNENDIYLGGDFTTIWNGSSNIPRNRIARVNAAGTLSTWNPNADGAVTTMAVRGTYIYVGGAFSNIGSNPRPRLSAVKISDGTSSTWIPSPNDTVKSLAVSGDTLFVGGDFTSIASATRNRVAAFNVLTNALTTFDPNANGEVQAVAIKKNILFIGGSFTTIGGQSRNCFAAYNAKTNALQSMQVSISSTSGNLVYAMAAGDSAAYVSGKFTFANTWNINNWNATAIKVGTSRQSKWWHPDPNGLVRTMFLYKDKLYLGGDFTESLNIYQPYFTAVDNFCSVDNFLPLPADTNFCQGDSVPLWAAYGVGYKYQWYKDNVLIAGATKRYHIPLFTGWYKVLITDSISYGALYTNARHVTVEPLASTTVTASGPLVFCAASGQSVVLTAASGTGYVYQWFKNGSAIGIAASKTYTATTSGSYYCIVYNSFGCPKQSETVTVNAAGLSPVMSLTGANPFCQGSTVTLSSNLSTGYFHQWYKDNLKLTGSTGQSLIVSSAGTYKVRDSIGTCAGFSNVMTLTVNPLPGLAGSITGETLICPNVTTAIYSVAAIANATSYVWTLPSGATGVSSTNSITVTFGGGFTGGNITVKGHNSCGDGSAGSLLIAKGLLPSAAGTITGENTICPNVTTAVYSVAAIANATSYVWTLPTGATGASTTNSINVTFGAGFTGGNITVKGNNSCGDGTSSSLAIAKGTLPGAAGTITGPANICPSTTLATYSVPAISSTTTYIWTLPTGMTGTSATNAINVTISGNFNGGTISVKGHNSCGDGTAGSLIITKGSLPSAAAGITGADTVCPGLTSTNYSVPIIAGATTYNWTLPSGFTGSSASNSISVTISPTFTGGTISVSGSNSCGDGPSSSKTITKGQLPLAAGVISGQTVICSNTTSATYTVPSVSGATSYTWTLPVGTAGGSTTNSLILYFGGGFTGGDLTVKGHNQCGDGTASSLTLIKGLPPGSAGAISGPTSVFKGSSGNLYMVNQVSGATSYSWTLPPGATGSSTSYIISVNFGSQAVSGNITVKPLNDCGQGPVSSLAVMVQNPPPQFAPVTTCASKGAPNNSPATVPVTVTGFDSITSMSLRLDYDPTLLTYTGNANANPVLAGLIVNDIHVSATLHKIILVWTDVIPRTLPANSKIVDLNFTHISGTTLLNWNNTSNGGSDCEYADKNGDPLWDTPSSQFYINGDVHLQAGYKVSGNFNYNNTAATILDNIKVYLKLNAIKIDSATTNTNGYYEFPIVQNNTYTLEGNTTKPFAGINGTDALKIQRHFAGLELLTEPVRLLAADVNLSNSINGTDALKVKRRFAGLDTTFARGNWTFAKQIVGGDTVIVAGTDVTANFFGLCVGDVNGSNTPSPGKSLLTLISLEHNGTIEAGLGKEFELPLTILQDAQLGALSLVFNYPAENLSLTGISMNGRSLTWNVQGDQIRVAWSEIDALNYKKDDNLLMMRFRLNKPIDEGQALTLSLGHESELADSWAEPIVCTLNAPSIVSGNANGVVDPIAPVQNCQIWPNPATEKLTVEFDLSETAEIRITLIDQTGRQVAELLSEALSQGTFRRTFSLNNLPPGMYTVKIASADASSWSFHRKLVIGRE